MKINLDNAPCTFCGRTDGNLTAGKRALICEQCINDLRQMIHRVARPPHEDQPRDVAPAGVTCCFCESIITEAPFSARRWIFSVCNLCIAVLAFDGAEIVYRRDPSTSDSYAF